MKKIYLIGFRGIGFAEILASESPLIQAGHVGIPFEGDENTIYGFHPPVQEVERAGGIETLFAHLLEGNSCPGTLQQDLAVFLRANELAEQGKETTVWQITMELSSDEFERAQQQAFEWYTKQTSFAYAFPTRRKALLPDRDNCATFPRRLGLPLLEPSGKLFSFISILEKLGKRWKP